MKRFLPFWMLIVSAVLNAPAHAGANALAQQLYEVSGLGQQIAMIPKQTERSFDLIALSNSMPLDFAQLDQSQIRAAVPESFSEARLQSEMLAALVDVEESNLSSMIDWFNSELGNAVRQAELENSLLSNPERFAAYKARVRQSPVKDSRVAIAKRLDKSLKVSESAADTLINIQIGFTLSIMRAAGTPMQVEEYVQSVRATRSSIVDSYRSDSVETILFIYQDLTDEELSRFADTMYLRSSRQYINASNSGIANGMLAASSQLGTRIGEMFGGDQSGI